MWAALALYAVLSAAMFYLGSRAMITQGLWSLYPPRLARFMDCAACTGFWWGVWWALILGRRFGVGLEPFLSATHPAMPLTVGLCMIILAPIAAALGHHALHVLGSAVPGPDDDVDPAA